MNSKECLEFLESLLESGHRLAFEQASGSEIVMTCTVPSGTWIAEGEDLRDAAIDMRRFIYGKPNAT